MHEQTDTKRLVVRLKDKVRLGIWALLLLVLVGCWIRTTLAVAVSNEFKRESLHGLEGVRVGVTVASNIRESRREEVITDIGLAEKQLQTNVELKLRLAGIPALTGEQWDHAPGRPGLRINVLLIPQVKELGAYFYIINLDLYQDVFLARDLKIRAFAPIWSSSYHGISLKESASEEIRKGVSNLLDEFMNDYLAENPKEQKESAPSK